MAWNQPGNRNNDPWRGKDPNREVQAFVARLRGMFGGGGAGRSSEAFNPLPLVAGLLLVWLVFDSFKMIDARERGVVLRFGEFSRMMEPGANFKLPRPIERVVVVQAQEVAATSDQMLVLTRDENLVEIGYNVQFQITEPKDFLFGTRDPRDLIRQITESAVREAIGNADLDTALNRRDTLTPGGAGGGTGRPRQLQHRPDCHLAGPAHRRPAGAGEAIFRRRDRRRAGCPAIPERRQSL
ncbi:MAG: hypothetical protein KatS3mg128_0182 [Silanimonas sp.]|nr:MAG: hypothetical protein KatS3mg128_0182 [Silanimonas sp.]